MRRSSSNGNSAKRRSDPATNISPETTLQAENGGTLIVITAPLTEAIDHAGYFIQMAMASLPIWMEFVLNSKYPKWRDVEVWPDGSARYMPAGARLVEQSLLRQFSRRDVVACYPADLPRFIGPRTRVVAVSTHNPLGVTFAAGVYTSIFGSSKAPINSHYSRELFAALKHDRYRQNFKVIVGGSGGWQITQTDSFDELGVDCVVEGRSESEDTLELFRKAVRSESLPRQLEARHPTTRESILFPDRRTTFGVVEMTTGCGRRCQFCVPDLNPQIDLPKDRILGTDPTLPGPSGCFPAPSLKVDWLGWAGSTRANLSKSRIAGNCWQPFGPTTDSTCEPTTETWPKKTSPDRSREHGRCERVPSPSPTSSRRRPAVGRKGIGCFPDPDFRNLQALGMRIIVDNLGDILGGGVGIHQVTGLPMLMQHGDQRIFPMQEHLVIQFGIDPGLDHLIDIAKIHHHAPMVEMFADNLHFNSAVVAVEMATFPLIVEQAMAVAEIDVLGDSV